MTRSWYDDEKNLEKNLQDFFKYHHMILDTDVTWAIIGGGGGGVYSYIRVMPDGFLLQSTQIQKNLSGRTWIYE